MDVKKLVQSGRFSEEMALFNFVANLEACAELQKALCEQRLMELGLIPKEQTFRRPDLHIHFRMHNTEITA